MRYPSGALRVVPGEVGAELGSGRCDIAPIRKAGKQPHAVSNEYIAWFQYTLSH